MYRVLSFMLLLLFFSPGISADTLELGLKTTHFDYIEKDSDGNKLDTEEAEIGQIIGGYLRYNMPLRENGLGGSDGIELYGSRCGGTTRYVGSLIDSDEPYGSYVSTTNNTFTELQFILARSLKKKDLFYTFRAGMGYFAWDRELSASQVEEYSWNTFQLGIGVSKIFDTNWEIAMDLTAQYGFNGSMETFLSEPGNLEFDLGNIYTLKAGVPLTVPVTDALAMLFRMEYEYTKIGKSDIDYGTSTTPYLEPDSQQYNWHLYAGLKFSF